MKLRNYLYALSFVLILLTSFQIQAQNSTFSCGFTPNAGQIQHYQNKFPLSTASLTATNATSSSNYSIHVWVIRDNAATNLAGPSAEDIQNAITDMNPAFNFSNGAKFALCGITYVNDSDFTNMEFGNNAKDLALYNKYQKSDEINFYIVGNIIGVSVGAYTNYPWSGSAPILVFKGSVSTPVIAHEMGHFFGLFHTHERINGQENVARTGAQSNCNTSGDLLFDTEADIYSVSPTGITNCPFAGQKL